MVGWTMFEALKKYAVFSGRARRKEYWLFVLLLIIANLIGIAIDMGIGTYNHETGMGAIGAVITLGFIIPLIAVTIRRLHDTDRSGWWFLLGLIPIANIVLLVFLCLDSTPGENRFDANPKSRFHWSQIR